jgi:hypothetical protein
MTPGSRFAIHRTGTQDPKKTAPIAEGEITEVNVTTSVLKLSQPLDKDKIEALKTARAFETSHKFGDLRLEVDARGLAGNPRGGEIINDLKSSDLISAEPGDGASWDVRICRGDCPDTKPLSQGENVTGPAANSFTLQRDDGSVIKRIADGPDVAGEIRRALEGEARWRFIKALENTGNPRIKIKFRLVPVTDVKIGASGLASSAVRKAEEVTPGRGGQVVLHEGDYVMIEVMNEGDIPAYVTILDLRVDGTIGPLWPHPLVPVGKSEENQIPPDKRWHLIPAPFVIQISEPFGPEVFKAIATSEPTDFSPLVDFSTISRGSPRGNARGAKESLSPIGQLLMTATLGRSRGAGLAGKLTATALDPSDWSTSVVTFEARPKGTGN